MLNTLLIMTMLGTTAVDAAPPTQADIQESIARNDLESAAQALHQLIEKDPNNLEAILALALLRMEQNSFSDAAELFTRVLTLDPWEKNT